MTGSARHCLSGIPRSQEREAIVQDHRKPVVRGLSIPAGQGLTAQGLMHHHTQFSHTVLPSKLPTGNPGRLYCPKPRLWVSKSLTNSLYQARQCPQLGRPSCGGQVAAWAQVLRLGRGSVQRNELSIKWVSHKWSALNSSSRLYLHITSVFPY